MGEYPWIDDYIQKAIKNNVSTPPIILGIGGPAGVGKSTFARDLSKYLLTRGHKTTILELDDFILSRSLRPHSSEWGPDHINIEALRRILYLIKRGERRIDIRKHANNTRRSASPWIMDLIGIRVVIFEGVYALNNVTELGKFSSFLDLSIYMHARPIDLKSWRFQQEKRKMEGRTAEEMNRHWKEGILPDLYERVMPTKNNAKIIIEVDHKRTTRIFLNIRP